jgi:hypothetical protein
MCMCVRGIDFAFVSTIFLLEFETVLTVCSIFMDAYRCYKESRILILIFIHYIFTFRDTIAVIILVLLKCVCGLNYHLNVLAFDRIPST